jgi:hypothetical protein
MTVSMSAASSRDFLSEVVAADVEAASSYVKLAGEDQDLTNIRRRFVIAFDMVSPTTARLRVCFALCRRPI